MALNLFIFLSSILRNRSNKVKLKNKDRKLVAEELITLLKQSEFGNAPKKEILERVVNIYDIDETEDGFGRKIKFYEKYSKINYNQAVVEIIDKSKLPDYGNRSAIKISNVYDFEGEKLADITWDIIDESKLIFVEPFDR